MANTSAPLSEVAVANFAVTTLDDTALTTLDDPGTLARFMARNFGFIRDVLLRQFPWNFAKARVVLTRDADNAPPFGYKYQYRIPADCLRVLPLTHCGEHNGIEVKHTVEGDYILTDAGPTIRVRYIRKITAAAKFDPLFGQALGALLGMMAAQRVTGKASYFEKAKASYQEIIQQAYLVNSLEGGTPENYIGEDAFSVRGVGL